MRLQRRFKDLGIEGATARWYDSNTKKNRLREMEAYAKDVSMHAQDGASILEVAPGPGYLAIELAKTGRYRVTGIDISKDFVEIAKRNARDAGVEVDFRQGNASAMPFADNTFDFIICTAAFKNFKEPLRALMEMHRVLKTGGTALVVDMNKKASYEQIDAYAKSVGAAGRDGLFMKLIFKYFLRNGAYTRKEIESLISKTPFASHEIREEGIGFYIYLRR